MQVIKTIPVRFYEGDEQLIKWLEQEKKRTGNSYAQILKNLLKCKETLQS